MTMKLQRFIAYLISYLVLFGIASCSAPLQPEPIKIRQLIFLNKSSDSINDVRIYIHNTHEFVNCGYILPNSECSIEFRPRKYQGNRFNISWEVNGKLKLVENILVQVPDDLVTGKPVKAVITFDQQGSFNAKLQH